MQARAAELDELRAYVEELRSERDEAIHHAGRARQTAEALQAECERLAAELRAQRDRSARAEGELLRRSAPPPQPPVPAGDPAELEKANARWKQAEAKSDELWRKIGEMQRELEQNREQAVETARQQRQAAQVALTRAMEEASKKLVSAKDEATRGERERGELESTVTGLKAELAKARQTGEDARAELETIRVMSAQGYLEVRQEITRAREQAAEETHRAATEREAGQRREAAVATRLEELDEIVRILAAGLREEELRLGQLEDGIRTVHQHAHSIPDPEEMERELVKHAIDGRDHLQLLAVRERRIQRLTVELGERDAELAILHAAVSTARGQVLDLVEMIRKTRQDISGRASAVDIVAALDRLAAEASELTGRL
jgi:chromosome segregation ATPase